MPHVILGSVLAWYLPVSLQTIFAGIHLAMTETIARQGRVSSKLALGPVPKIKITYKTMQIISQSYFAKQRLVCSSGEESLV